MKAAHLKQGEDAEQACCHYLKKKGLRLVEKNYHSRCGEIDIIMLDKKTLVFVEVRFRKNNNFGGGLESITTAKQQKLRKAAELYLQQNRQHENARFDVVSMSKSNQTSNSKQPYSFDWIMNAF
ncbi:Predicted endonuclease distantly related to archaeal Holliday junction resolvase [hydrothermal vent metagenome]|uniref:Predicted endonuclease distantly related to archaeal Holliday junction resolvase n=1 Tax=hydrothermal vent metagenome TaxID=652676 RepID=A0A3B0WEF5_9ZZZZ